jgi:propanol-preferring alcohol dehydrogenase
MHDRRKVGDRAGIKWVVSIRSLCEFHTNGTDELHCPKQANSGFSAAGTFQVSRHCHIRAFSIEAFSPGPALLVYSIMTLTHGIQQYCIADGKHTTRIPEGVTDEEAGRIMCGGVTAYTACKRSAVKPGQWIVLPGAGGRLGHFAVQYAKAMGMRVVAIDGGDEKRDLCKRLGAEALYRLYYEQGHCVVEVMALTTYGAHGVIVTTATRQGVRECAGLPAAGRHVGRGGLSEGPYLHSGRAVDARIEEASDCRLGRGHVEGCRGGIGLYCARPCSCELKPLGFYHPPLPFVDHPTDYSCAAYTYQRRPGGSRQILQNDD